MKPLYKILFTLLLLLPFTARGEEVFAQLAENKQVESTYVSGRFAHNMKSWYSRTGQHSMNLSQGFSSLYNYQCYSTESVALARKILKEYLEKDKGMELVMRTNNYGAEYMVYEKFNKDDKLERMIIWNCEGANLCEIVVVDWNDGLLRDTSSVFNPGRTLNLNALSNLSQFSNLSVLSDLSELAELSDLSELSELSDLTELSDYLSNYISDFDFIIEKREK